MRPEPIELNGKLYHAEETFDEEGNPTGVQIMEDKYGPIEATVCLCAARCSFECACGVWDIDEDYTLDFDDFQDRYNDEEEEEWED